MADMWCPTGFCVGPILFILYTADLVSLVEQHGFRPHLYADDTQVRVESTPLLDIPLFSLTGPLGL